MAGDFQVGAAIRRARLDAGLTMEDAAAEADISTTRLQRIETIDGNFNRWLRDIEKVAVAVGVPLETLIAQGRVA